MICGFMVFSIIISSYNVKLGVYVLIPASNFTGTLIESPTKLRLIRVAYRDLPTPDEYKKLHLISHNYVCFVK